MAKAKVLYVDYHRGFDFKTTIENLERKLRKAGIKFDVFKTNREDQQRIPEEFIRDYIYHGKLSKYNVLIAHLGVAHQEEILNALEEYRNLDVVAVTCCSGDFTDILGENRVLVCDYDSPKLIPFIKKALKKK